MSRTNFDTLLRLTFLQRSGILVSSRGWEVHKVVVYADVVMLLNFLVDLLLLVGTNCLAGYGAGWKRSTLAAAMGGVYAGLCVLPQLRFLGNMLWRLLSLGAMAVISFGWNRCTLRKGILFTLLSMALGGVALAIGRGGFAGLILSAGLLCSMCFLGFRGKAGQAEFVPVQIVRQGRTYRLTALRDTGNTLRDPVTGQQVLVVGADVACAVGSEAVVEVRIFLFHKSQYILCLIRRSIVDNNHFELRIVLFENGR